MLPGEAQPRIRAGWELKLNIQSTHGIKLSLGLCADSARGTRPALTGLQQPHSHLPLGAARQEKSPEGITFDLRAIWKPHSDSLLTS